MLLLSEWLSSVYGVAGVSSGRLAVTNCTLTSASGVDWTQPIPEPGTAAFVLAGLAVLGAVLFRGRNFRCR